MTLATYKHDALATLRQQPQKLEKRQRRFLKKFSLKRAVITLLVMVLLVVGYVGVKFLIDTHRLFGGSLFGFLQSTTLRGEDRGRVNILLAGNSADDSGHNGAQLTDSIMVISVDTVHHTAFMLSIPRDMWVDIPGDGYQKINAAYVYGQNIHFHDSGYPSGGMGLLEETVEQNFGIPIDYYGLVDYTAFKQAVDAVGGIDVTINSDDPRGLYDPSIDWTTHGPLVKLTNGRHHLSGEQALDLARARGDAYGSYGFDQSDFDRTTHQRAMLLALKDKAVSAGVLANPVKLTNLFDAIGSNVKTDFKLSEVRRLYDLTKDINGNHIKSYSLNDADGVNLLKNYTTPDGQSALIPAAGIDDYSQIQIFIKRLTSNDPIVREEAKVVVLNGTQTYGLAGTQAKSLEAKNVDVVATGNAAGNQSVTTIIDNSHGHKPHTLQLLTALYGKHITKTNPYAGTYDADFIVVLGADQVTL